MTWNVSHFKVSHNHVHFYSGLGCSEALPDDLLVLKSWTLSCIYNWDFANSDLVVNLIPLSMIESMHTKNPWTEDDGGYRGKCFVATSWKVLMQHTEVTASRLPPCVVVSFEPMPNSSSLPLQVCDWLDVYLVWNFAYVLRLLILDVMFSSYCKGRI